MKGLEDMGAGPATWESLREDARGFVPAERGRGRQVRGELGSEFARREAERAARVFGEITAERGQP